MTFLQGRPKEEPIMSKAEYRKLAAVAAAVMPRSMHEARVAHEASLQAAVRKPRGKPCTMR